MQTPGPWRWACSAHRGPRLALDPLVICPAPPHRPVFLLPAPLIPILRPLWVWPVACFEHLGLPPSLVYLWTSRNLRGLAKVPPVACGPLRGSWSAFHNSPAHTQAQEALGGTRGPMQPFVIWGLAATVGLYLGRGQVPAAPGSPNLRASTLPQCRQHHSRCWLASISQPPCVQEITSIILQTRKGGPVREVLE